MYGRRREAVEVLIPIGIAIILILGIFFCLYKIQKYKRSEDIKCFNNGIHSADGGRWVYKGVQVFEHKTTGIVIIGKSIIYVPGTSREEKFVYECDKCGKKFESDWDMQDRGK